MREIYINAPGEVKIRDAVFEERKKGEATLKLLYGGICGSDLGSFRGTFAYFDYPRIPGHEFSAEIIDIDEPNEYGLKKGMTVTCNPYFNCGYCYSCSKGRVNVCQDNQTLGCQRDGAFRTLFNMPLERIYDGQGLDAKTLALIEPFCIGHHGASRANIQPGEKVLVIGSGTIGVFAALSAKLSGAEVYMADISGDKLAMVMEKFNIDGTILNNGKENFAAEVARITGNCGFDVCIEAVGLPSTFQDCIDAACFGGRVVLIGVGKKNLDFNFTQIQKKELSVFGSRNSTKNDFLELIEAVRTGKVDISNIVSKVYDFEDAIKAFQDFSDNQGTMFKVLIKF